jgi:hypothetical protein
MTLPFPRELTAAILALVLAGLPASAQVEPPNPLDKSIYDSLKDVHNYGADLYNQSKDYTGSYRVYEGALKTVRPLLSYRPASQKTIDGGLAAATAEPEMAKRAFLLHETIEKVRAELKTAGATPKKPEEKKPDETKKPEPKPEVKKPEPAPEPKKTVGTKPADPVTPAPAPMPKGPPEAAKTGVAVSGKISVAGKPLSEGEITFISLGEKAPIVTTGTVKDGGYSVTGLKAGKYAVTVTGGKDVKAPAKYATSDSSGLTAEVKIDGGTFDFDLK